MTFYRFVHFLLFLQKTLVQLHLERSFEMHFIWQIASKQPFWRSIQRGSSNSLKLRSESLTTNATYSSSYSDAYSNMNIWQMMLRMTQFAFYYTVSGMLFLSHQRRQQTLILR